MSFQRIAWGITGAGHFLTRSYDVFKKLKGAFPSLAVNTYVSRAAEEVIRMYGLEQKLVKLSGGDYLEEIFLESEQGSSSPKVGRFLLEKYDALLVTPATSNTVSKIAYGIADSLVTNAVAQAVKGRVPVYIVPVDIEGSIVSELPYSIDRGLCRHCESCPPRKLCPNGAIEEKNGLTAQIDLLKCRGCGLCKEVCPHFAIKGGPVEVLIRDVDRRNVETVKKLQGINVLENPEQLIELFH
ncbi:MAG: dihydromethanopterin reductase (acceptor) [Methanosarcinaceae archaeon]|nr:dihydromethanopterin reductase (acceptor) [Methanosarcinaceae archaeon]MDD4748552.1 dihydromethanopterin reductase (acceptor) [Methanosarcinaceae archaeon]